MISILIPVYNTAAIFLNECINSCLNQTFKNYEIVIIDNGSTNQDTLDILNKYTGRDNIKVFKCDRIEGKKNLSVALNYGLQKCKYNLIARMDSDDIMCHDRLQKQKDFFMTNEDVDILGGQIKIFPQGQITNHKNIITKDIALNSYWFINHPTVMFKKDKILSIGGYKEEPELFAEDYELWIKSLINNLKIRNLKDVVVFYRSHGNNLTRKTEKSPTYYDDLKAQQEKLRRVYNDID